MALTTDQERVVAQLQATVLSLLARAEAAARQVETARDWLDWVPDWGLPVPGLSLLSAARELLGNDTQAQVVGALRQVADLVPRWAGPDGQKYMWLMRGLRDDGTPYPAQLWVDEGNAIASTLASGLQEVHNASTLTVLAQTGEAVEDAVADAGRAAAGAVGAVAEAASGVAGAVVGPWSWPVKLALGGVATVAVLGAGSLLWQSMRATPAGMAVRGAGLALRVGARPLANAARAAGARVVQRIEQAERAERATVRRKPRRRK
ncbi:hypothetical protein LY474_40490 [Myxococcus stipitatus]|uniref:hypothetical protein n=1 Tax=Myxococcus stipitatus TaxID=83455 RepID=UPI001F44F038|nr:hypothetical protein [Myxococcus stipitatus]MCE9674087.1 hypothetical protein [Myxococcus stipitatus]